MLILNGDVEEAYTLDVTREGFVVIPVVGQIPVSSLSLGDLDSVLRKRLARVYSGIKTLAETKTHLERVDAVMIGRAAYDNPYVFAEVDREIFGDRDARVVTRHEVVERMLPYVEAWVAKGGKFQHIGRHLLMIFSHQPGTGAWKRYLAEHG